MLEESARLAAEDASRREAQGEVELQATERERATRALAAARQARSASVRLGREASQS